MDVLSQMDELGPILGGVLDGITPDQLDKPTPCSEFDVKGVLEHMIGGATLFAAAYRGEEPGDPPAGDVLTAFPIALGAIAEALHAPGALDKTIESPFGPQPGETFARYVVLDGLVHGWDLSRATGQAYDPPDALVADADAFAHELLPSLRGGDAFADETPPPANATPIERLVAYTGRTV